MDAAILLHDSPGEKTDTSLVGAVKTLGGLMGRKQSSVVIVRGELLLPIPGSEISPRSDGQKPHNYHLKRDPSVSLFCTDDIAPLGDYEFLLLEGIKSQSARYDVFISAHDMLEWGAKLKRGDIVYVALPALTAVPTQYATAVIRYVGGLEKEPGVQFGVEIMDPQFRGCGSTNGYFQGEQCFECEENCGLFVGLDKLSRGPQGSSRAKGSSSSQSVADESSVRRSPTLGQRHPDSNNQHGMLTRSKETNSGSSVDAPPNAFKIGHRVVVYNKKNIRVPGVVAWVGKHSSPGVNFTVLGIETDYPVKREDIAEALPNLSHYFKVRNPQHGKVFLPEAFVVHEKVDAQLRAQQQKGTTYKEDQFQDQQIGGTLKEKGKRQALAMEFGISPREIAEQQQALNYANEQKEIEGLKKFQNRKEFEEVQKAVTEQIDVKEQRQRLEEIKQKREKLNMPAKDAQHNATATGAGVNIPSVQVPSSHSGTHPSHRGPGLPHQQTQPPPQHFQNGGRLGLTPQLSLDETRSSHRPPARHNYETVRGETSDVRNSREDTMYDTIGSRGYRGPQSGEQPFLTQRTSQNPAPLQQASQNEAPPRSAPLYPSPRPSPQPTPSQHWDPHQNSFFTDQAPYAFTGSSQQHGVLPVELGLGSTVQISDPPRYGVIRWIGELPNIQGSVAGVELDEYMDGCADGTWQEMRYFTCPYGRGFFCPYYNLRPDQRFSTSGTTPGATPAVNPLVRYPLEERSDQTIMANQMEKYLGDERGIQGHQNSCYLDATVFGLFALSDDFDSMFLTEAKDAAGKEISGILWKGIVNPLRKNGIVRHESVMKLRNKLEELGKMKGVNQDEKDPEEFLNLLFKHILNVEPFVNIKRPYGEEPEYFVQLFVDYDESLKLPTVGELLKKMFREQDITFTLVPSRLLIQVPRFGKQYKTYQKIIPAEKLKVAELTMSPHLCFNCEKPAWKQCSACFEEYRSAKRTKDGHVYFCDSCVKLVHSPKSRSDHSVEQVVPPPEVADVSELELLSVICIETSHYVCFTRSEGRWIFFDSMANRVYDMYNIPKGVDCTQELNEWVYSGDHQRLLDTPPRELPEYVRRFTQDIYMCVYVNHDVIMYGI